jgi:hypothetical protein
VELKNLIQTPALAWSAMAVVRSLGGPPCMSIDQKSGRGRQFHHVKLGLDQFASGHRHGCLCREAARALRCACGAAPRDPIQPTLVDRQGAEKLHMKYQSMRKKSALLKPNQ